MQQQTPDYQLGYVAGARTAARSPNLSDIARHSAAKLAYGRPRRQRPQLDQKEFVAGFAAGSLDYLKGIH